MVDRRDWSFFWVVMLMALHLSTAGATAIIEVDYSHRQVGDGWSAPGFEEGRVLATFRADRPIDLVGADSIFTRVDPETFERAFSWWETDTLTAIFVDAEDDTTTVRAFPESVFPFDTQNHDLPVVHITTEPANLWSPQTGIYVYGDHLNWNQRGEQWERPATFTYRDAQGNLEISRPIGLRVHGGYSRSYPQKSFRMYFDHDGEPETVEYPFFSAGDGPFARLLLRSCYHPGKLINDRWACSLFADMGHEISDISCVVAYLNDEYWGVYHLRERLDDEWAEVTLGLDPDQYILIKDGEAEHGDPADWWDFLDWVNAPVDPTSHGFYVQVGARLDLSTYIDWLLVNIFAAPSDNGYMHNLVLLKADGGPWQFIMWDQDDLFQTENRYSDYFRFFSAGNAEDFATYKPPYFGTDDFEEVAPWFGIFHNLMQNAEFRTRFFNRQAELAGGLMSLQSMRDRLDEISAEQGPEVDRHGHKYWFGNGLPYTTYVNRVRLWLSLRSGTVSSQVVAFRQDSLADVELSLFTAVAEANDHHLTWRTEVENDCDGFAIYHSASPDGPFTLLADHTTDPQLAGAGGPDQPAEYSFLVTGAPAQGPRYYQLHHLSAVHGEVTHSWIEGVGEAAPRLRVNEFMARNSSTIADETGAYEDWVEIHNSGGVAVDLGGMFLTDDAAEPTQWAFPAGTIIPAGGHLLVWCDSDPEDGPLHTTFKLSGDGETIALFDRLVSGNGLIDSRVFGAQESDVSEGRRRDGSPEWVFFTSPTPGATNDDLSGADLAVPAVPMLGSIAPNPFNPATTISFHMPTAQKARLAVYDAAGRRVRVLQDGWCAAGRNEIVWQGRDEQGGTVASGVYQVRLESGGIVRSRKLTLLK